MYCCIQEDGSYSIHETQARWNGLEFRTDDFGLSETPNLFDRKDIIPCMWTHNNTEEARFHAMLEGDS